MPEEPSAFSYLDPTKTRASIGLHLRSQPALHRHLHPEEPPQPLARGTVCMADKPAPAAPPSPPKLRAHAVVPDKRERQLLQYLDARGGIEMGSVQPVTW